MRKYVEVNISQKSQTTIKYLLKMMSSVTETIIFMYLGISAVSDLHIWNTGFVLLTLVFCLVYRVLGVVILTSIANRVRLVRLNRIDQFIMAYGGLRGAIAFALSVLLDDDSYPHKKLFVSTTVVIVYFTNLIMGSTVKPLVTFLKVKRSVDRQLSMNEKLTLRLMDHLMVGIEDLSGQKGHHQLRERFSHFNNKYLKPVIVGRHHPSQKRGYEIFNVYKRLTMKDAKEMAKNPMSATSISRMQTHLRQLSSMPEMISADQRLSASDLSLYDVPSLGFGSTPNFGTFSPGEYTPNGHYGEVVTTNGGFNIDRANGRIIRTRTQSDEGIIEEEVESMDLSYNPGNLRPSRIYRRHVLSSSRASSTQLGGDTNGAPGTSAAAAPPHSCHHHSHSSPSLSPDDSEDHKKRVSFSADFYPSVYAKRGSSSTVDEDAEVITFHACQEEICDERGSMSSVRINSNSDNQQQRRIKTLQDRNSEMHDRTSDQLTLYELRHCEPNGIHSDLHSVSSGNLPEEEKNERSNSEAGLNHTQGVENEAYVADEDFEDEAVFPIENTQTYNESNTDNRLSGHVTFALLDDTKNAYNEDLNHNLRCNPMRKPEEITIESSEL